MSIGTLPVYNPPSTGGGGADFTGFTDGSVIFVESEAAQEDNANLFYDDTNDVLSVGSNSTSVVEGGSAIYPRVFSHQGDSASDEANFGADRAGADAVGPSIHLLKSRGTKASRSAVTSGDSLGTIEAYGYDAGGPPDFELSSKIDFDTHGTIGTGVDGRIKFNTSSSGSEVTRFIAGGPTHSLGAFSLTPHLTVHGEDLLAAEAAFYRHRSSTSVGGNFGLFKSWGTESAPTAATFEDTIGTVFSAANDGSGYEQIADILFKTGSAAVDTGEIFLRSRAAADGAPVTRVRIHDEGLVEIGSGGSYSFVSGGEDLGIKDDLEVLGQSFFEGTMGWKTNPETTSAFVALYTDSTVTSFFRVKATYSGTSLPASGYNVMNFESRDGSTSSSSAGVHAIRASAYFDRTAPSGTHELVSLQVPAYGQASSRTISSGTYDWKGIEVTAAAVAGIRVSGGTFTMIDCDLGAAPDDYSGASSFTHYSLRCAGVSRFNDTVFVSIDDGGDLGVGTSTPATPIETEEIVGTGSGITDGYAASVTVDPGYDKTGGGLGGVTITRHNYIDLNDPSLDNSSGIGSISLTDACVFRFDASAGTHKAIDGSSTKSSPGSVDAWMKININGTVYYIPSYTSKTS